MTTEQKLKDIINLFWGEWYNTPSHNPDKAIDNFLDATTIKKMIYNLNESRPSIVVDAVNAYYHSAIKSLEGTNLGDIERKIIEKTRDEAKLFLQTLKL